MTVVRLKAPFWSMGKIFEIGIVAFCGRKPSVLSAKSLGCWMEQSKKISFMESLSQLVTKCERPLDRPTSCRSPKTSTDGLQTQVGPRGTQLSGGQKQRVAIARLLLKDCPIIILDEATSALDAQSERYVQKAIESAMKGRTVISIAHRLQTIKFADRIAVLRDGEVAETGTYEELVSKKDSAFRALMGRQIGE
mmetsp:Transcript_25344/g.70000  ORF Transcript_25344/g.70000 Transcript_25344/m.70000 type:complete len:194 (-) Transcript_25344:937-1518(-)